MIHFKTLWACVALLATAAAAGQGRDSLRVTIFFRVGETTIDRSYMDNEGRLQRFERAVGELNAANASNAAGSPGAPSITSAVISASASPEGNAAQNRALAARRADAAAMLLHELMPGLQNVERTSEQAQDWAAFRGVIAADRHVPAREQLLAIIDNTDLNDADRNYQIRRLAGGTTWEYVKWNILRTLRTGSITLTINQIPPKPQMPDPVQAIEQPRCMCSDCGMNGGGDVSECTCAMPLKNCICAKPKPEPKPQPAPRKRYQFALKTNLLFDAVGAANLGVELPLGKHLSITADAAYSFWRINNLYALQTIQGGVAAKWWFNPRRGRLTGWNAGVYGMYCTRYDVQWLDGLQGDGFWSAGVQGGYAMPIAKRLRLEFAAAAGYVHTPEVRFYDRPERGHLMWRQTRWGVGRVSLTKVQLNLVWLLGKGVAR